MTISFSDLFITEYFMEIFRLVSYATCFSMFLTIILELIGYGVFRALALLNIKFY